MNNYQPIPAYSLFDLFRDIENGYKEEFTYNGNTFTANRKNFTWTVTDKETGHAATSKHYIGNMTTLQGMASCLRYYNKSLQFDKDGNIIA